MSAPAIPAPSDLTHRRVLTLAAPIFLANVTVPLVGVTDTAVMGHAGTVADLGAVALGALAFNFIFWGFGFLRMGTTGLTAQAHGRGDGAERLSVFARAALLALALGLLLIALQMPIKEAALSLFQASADVEAGLATYLGIRIWAAPATLLNYALVGWFVGRQETGVALLLTAVINATNIVLDLLFVLVFDLGVAGVAFATLAGEYAAMAIGLTIVARRSGIADRIGLTRDRVLDLPAFRRLVAVNADIFVRTLCLVGAFVAFGNTGAALGDRVLAANQILLQFLTVAAYALDAFAHVAESVVGAAVGRRDRPGFRRACRVTTELAVLAAAGVTAVYALFGTTLIALMTDLEAVRAAAAPALPFAVLIPIVGVWSYQLDGIFIGATRTAAMRNAMLVSVAGYGVALWLLVPMLGNTGLWLAFSGFMGLRAVSLAAALPALDRAIDLEAPPP